MATYSMPFLLATLAALVLSGCASPAAEDSDATEITMENFKFTEDQVTVKAGSTVTWANKDPVGHTVTPTDKAQWATDGSGDAQNEWLQKGESWSFTFTKPGTYAYYCIPHSSQGNDGEWSGMVARVVVTA